MSITINIYYTGKNDDAKKFVDEMINNGIVDKIKKEKGNLKYEYFYCINDPQTILLIDSWENQKALDIHHQSEMMNDIIKLRDKYNLSMKVERYINDDKIPNSDIKYIKK